MEEIKQKKATSIVDAVQKLQQHCFRKKVPGRENVTKVFSSRNRF
jgi:hypothetical protein